MSAAASDHKDQNRRQALEGLRSANAPLQSGAGIDSADMILIRRFSNRRSCRRFLGRLSEAGIASKTKSDRAHVSVFVEHSDREQALAITAEHLQRFPDTTRKGLRRDFDLKILVAVMSLLLAPFAGAMGGLAVLAAYVFSAVSIGAILGRCQRNYQWYGQYQFSMTELTIATLLIAVAIAFWRFGLS